MSAPRTLGAIAVAAVLVIGAAACSGSDSDGAAPATTTAPPGTVKVNTDDADNPTVEYDDGKGTTTEFGASLPQGWPEELTPPSTLTIVNSSTSQADGKTQLFVTGESTEAFDAVHQGIKDQLTSAGYAITSDLTTDDGDFVGVEAKGAGATVSVTVAGDPDTEKVTVLYTVVPKG